MICETRGHSPYVDGTDVRCHDCREVLASAETHSKAVGKMLDTPRPWFTTPAVTYTPGES